MVVATSSGWDNYRHQADALAAYQLLKSRGVRDDHIVLIMADDIAGNARNREPGVVRNVAGGGPTFTTMCRLTTSRQTSTRATCTR